jgi:hypothetical protein
MSDLLRTGDTPLPLIKKISVLKRIQRGLVIKGYAPEIGHNKYYIFMGFSEDSQFAHSFFINSNPSLIIITNPQIAKLQINIPPRSYNFLKKPKPSYINCLNYYQLDSYDMVNGLIDNPLKMCGYLSPKHLWEVVQTVQNNPSFTAKEKNIVNGPLIFPAALCPITTIL